MNQLIISLRKLSGKSTPTNVRIRAVKDIVHFLKTINELPLEAEGNFESWLGMLAAPFSQNAADNSGFLLDVQKTLIELGMFHPLRFLNWIFNRIARMSTQNSVRLFLLGTLPGFVTSITQRPVPSACSSVEHAIVVMLQHIDAFLAAIDQPLWLPPVTKVLLEVNRFHSMLLLPHFIHIVDIFIAWVTKSRLDSKCRNLIFDLLFQFNNLWTQNTVYSLRLLNAFAQDINVFHSESYFEWHRIDSLLFCFFVVARKFPNLVLPTDRTSKASSLLQKVLPSICNESYSIDSRVLLVFSHVLVSWSKSHCNNLALVSVEIMKCFTNSITLDPRNSTESYKVLYDMLQVVHVIYSCETRLDNTSIASLLLDKDFLKACLIHEEHKNLNLLIHIVCDVLVSEGPIIAECVLSLLENSIDESLSMLLLFAISNLPHWSCESLPDIDGSWVLNATFLGSLCRKFSEVKFESSRTVILLFSVVNGLIGCGIDGSPKSLVDGLLSMTGNIRTLSPCQHLLTKLTMQWIDLLLACFKRVIDCENEIFIRLPKSFHKHLVDRMKSSTVPIRRNIYRLLKLVMINDKVKLENRNEIVRVACYGALDRDTEARNISLYIINVCGLDGKIFASQEILLPMLYHGKKYLVIARDFGRFEVLVKEFCKLLQTESKTFDCVSEGGICTNSLLKYSAIFSNLWCVWHSALDCVEQRMKSSHGGAAQTFALFEKLLSSCIETIRLVRSSNKGYLLVYVRMLLEFVSALECYVGVASSGLQADTSTFLPTIDTPEIHSSASSRISYFSQATLLFFRKNQQVCKDWFSRMRSKVLELSVDCSMTAFTLRHGTLNALSTERNLRKLWKKRLEITSAGNEEFASSIKEFRTTVYAICSALCDIQETDSIVGLRIWGHSVMEKFQLPVSSLSWISGLEYESNGRLEDAVRAYSRFFEPVLKREVSVMSVGIDAKSTKLLINRVINCLIKLDALEDLHGWLISIQAMKDASDPQSFDLFSTKIDPEILRSLATFDTHHGNNNIVLKKEPQSVTSIASFVDESIIQFRLSTGSSIKSYSSAAEDYCREKLVLSLLDFSLNEAPVQDALFRLQCVSEKSPKQGLSLKSALNTSFYACGSKPDCEKVLIHSLYIQAIEKNNIMCAERLFKKLCGESAVCNSHVFEKAKLYYVQGRRDEAILDAWEAVKIILESAVEIGDVASKSHNLLCTFSSWLDAESCELDDLHLQRLKVGNDFADFNELSGKCLRAATEISPGASEAWLKYGNWCYEQSGKNFDEKTEAISIFRAALSQKLVRLDDENMVLDAVSHFLRASNTAEFDSKSDLVSELPWLAISPELLYELVETKKKFRDRYSQFCSEAVGSYKMFLQTAEANHGRIKSYTIITLRILHILVSIEDNFLSDVKTAVRDIPLSFWKGIIPQLLSRFVHPNSKVRSIISHLLERLCEAFPNLLAYPVTVKAGTLGDCVAPLRKALCLHHESYMVQVDTVVQELCRISLLKDEILLSKLKKCEAKIEKKCQLLTEAQTDAISGHMRINASEKYLQFMKSIFSKLSGMWRKISRDMETPHECKFLSLYGTLMDFALRDFKRSLLFETERHSFSIKASHIAIWAPFKSIISKLRASILKGNLPFEEISPKLSSLVASKGFHLPGSEVCPTNKISTISTNITVIRTKTNPKKFSLLGSDGEIYNYLLKGCEDLHLDERIMQILSTINTLLLDDAETSVRGCSARHYDVIPLSKEAGLIQMVPNVNSLADVYRKWQAIKYQKQPSPSNLASAGKVMVDGPSKLFYGKLIPAMTSVGLDVNSSRSEWPLEILRQVYHDLKSDVPYKLLEDELFLSSSGPMDWWRKQSKFTTSLAVMSPICYALGIGDRHLENMLFSVDTGEIIHIDYNISFDKGKTLKVPEIVPFRLTGILRGALGVTGLDGKFRAVFSNTLRVMRLNKETLAFLLEAFIYDPLVEWIKPSQDSDDVESISESMESTTINSLCQDETELGHSGSSERKYYATKVRECCIMKLEGMVGSTMQSVEEQTDSLIRQATDVDNLCQMFEGWTPWI